MILLPAVVFLLQAEDGIRDATVTGVQTCALPISAARHVSDSPATVEGPAGERGQLSDRKSTRLNSSHGSISYAVFCFTKKQTKKAISTLDNTATPTTPPCQPPTSR